MLRRATAADTAAVAVLFRRVRREALPYLKELHDGDEDRALFGRAILESEVWLVEAARDLLAFAAWRAGWLDHLYVAAEGRGRGVGRALVGAAQSGQACLRLWVFQRNAPAIAFYEHLGFRPERLTDGARNEEHEPDALYVWHRAAPRA